MSRRARVWSSTVTPLETLLLRSLGRELMDVSPLTTRWLHKNYSSRGCNVIRRCIRRISGINVSTWPELKRLLVPRVQVLGNQLRILSATPEDSGEYICRAQGNSENPGSHVHQASVSVSVTSSSSRKLVDRIYHIWNLNHLCLSITFCLCSHFKCRQAGQRTLKKLSHHTFQWGTMWPHSELFSLLLSHDLILIPSFLDITPSQRSHNNMPYFRFCVKLRWFLL